MRCALALVLLAGCRLPAPAKVADDAPVVVVAAGDISGPALGAQQRTAELAAQQQPAAVLILGDAQYPDGSLEDFQRYYGPTWGQFKAITWPAPGNHEYRSGGQGYFAWFGARAGEPSKGYYSFELGPWHLVALNTNHQCEQVPCDEDSEQVKWLEADLAKSTRACTLVYWHYPRFNSGSHGNFRPAQAFWNVLARHRVELVLNGHEHFYERLGPMDAQGVPVADGTVQLTVGTGGIGFSPFVQVHPASVARNNDTLGVLRLELSARGWVSEFVGVPGTTFVDRAQGPCRQALK